MAAQPTSLTFPEVLGDSGTKRRLAAVIACLSEVRLLKSGQSEATIRDVLYDRLLKAGFKARKEVVVPRGRADIVIEDVLVEVKKDKPAKASVTAQLTRYAAIDGINALVLVMERGFDFPSEIGGKPVRVISLHSLFGIVAI